MVLDPSGRMLISNNPVTFVCDGSDNGIAWFGYVTIVYIIMYNFADTSSTWTTNLVFKSILLQRVLSIHVQRRYALHSDITVHWSSHSTQWQRKTVFLQCFQSITWFSMEELTFKQFLTMESEYPACRAQNYIFPSYKGVERWIVKRISLQHVLNVSFRN